MENRDATGAVSVHDDDILIADVTRDKGDLAAVRRPCGRYKKDIPKVRQVLLIGAVGVHLVDVNQRRIVRARLRLSE